MRVKICGITNYDDAMVACDAGADALGFNFAEEAKTRNRYIAPDVARTIAAVSEFVDLVPALGNVSTLAQQHGVFAVWSHSASSQGSESIRALLRQSQIIPNSPIRMPRSAVSVMPS